MDAIKMMAPFYGVLAAIAVPLWLREENPGKTKGRLSDPLFTSATLQSNG
jgi:hypothetical protein